MKHLGDITKINGYEVPITDVVVGGSPCQDLSVAGLRKGMQHSTLGDEETTRSGLFMEQIRLVKEMRDADRKRRGTDVDIRPRYMLWENVPGAFSSNKGEDFRVVLEEVARVAEKGVTIPGPAKGKWTNSGVILGDSYSIAWRVFDAQYWGVPQRRRRICLVADFNGHSAAEIVFNEDKQHRSTNRRDTNASVRDIGNESGCEVQPICESLSGNTEPSNETRQEVTEDVGRSTEAGYPAFTYQDREGKPGGGKGGLIQEDKATSLRTNNYMTVFQPMVLESSQNHATITQNGVCPTLTASMELGGGYVPMVTQPTYSVDMGGGKSACDILEDKSPTLCTTHYGEPAVVYDARGNGDGQTFCNLTSRDESSLGDYSNVVVQPYEWHSQDLRVRPIDDGISPTLSAAMGMGGANKTTPVLIQQPYRKTSHPKTEDEPQGWEEARVNDTLNIFDNSEMRTPTVIVSMDRESFNCGQNFAQTQGIRDDGIQPTLVARGPGGVCYIKKSTQ